MPPVNLTRYNLTSFAITLNELTEGLQEKLPPTNSRLRPDQRYVENEDYEKANSDKQRLEKRQRMFCEPELHQGQIHLTIDRYPYSKWV
ncbi:hypothetical protein G4B88_020331 [Cannabis sativa]|uniref:Uncharacterized protein n=1 Tax=Cannabis sativa TaxID=3483 RepID=A0A7J6EQ81_CANSA|nr:hypothetical protein G4B88_020331 [Cannabis sativa]